MNRYLKQSVSICAIAVAATSAFAQEPILVTSGHQPKVESQRNLAVRDCVETIQRYQHKDAKLMLLNKGYVRVENGWRSFSVDGWVWRNGDRVKVSHECVAHNGTDRLALNVSFAGDQPVATR